jgi:hypothetical protein
MLLNKVLLKSIFFLNKIYFNYYRYIYENNVFGLSFYLLKKYFKIHLLFILITLGENFIYFF